MKRKARIQYSMLIEWSEEDQLYLVTLPEWSHQVMMPSTHRKSYAKAAKNGRQVLEMLVAVAKEDGKPLPPLKYTIILRAKFPHTLPLSHHSCYYIAEI